MYNQLANYGTNMLFGAAIVAVLGGFQSAENAIAWSDKLKLSYDDFKKIDTSLTKYGGYTASNFQINIDVVDTIFKYKVAAVFIPDSSALNYRSDYLLNHEQIHFDICEICARRMRQRFKAQTHRAFKHKNLDSILRYCYNELDMMQDVYDKETNHGYDSVKQKIWNKKTATWLNSLRRFADTSGVVIIRPGWDNSHHWRSNDENNDE